MPVRVAGERHSETDMERLAAERRACAHRDQMQKTKEPLYLPISDEALKWLPERGEAKDGDIIFPLTHEGTVNDTLQHWAKVAGITKHISFHVAKHHTISI